MRNLPHYFMLGTIGMVVTAILHMVMALFIHGPSVHAVFLGIYPAFLAFLVIGAVQLRKGSEPGNA